MKANELRIGNLITIDNSVYWPKLKDIPLIVTHIGQTMNIKGESSHSVGCEHINQKPNTYYEAYSQFIENIKPIPLTEEWLLKLGFENNGKEDASWIHPKEPLFEVTFFVEYEWQHVWDTSYTGAQIQYLHQIQNLFYALTGEELSLSGI